MENLCTQSEFVQFTPTTPPSSLTSTPHSTSTDWPLKKWLGLRKQPCTQPNVLGNHGRTNAKHLQTELKQIRTFQMPFRISDHEQRINKVLQNWPYVYILFENFAAAKLFLLSTAEQFSLCQFKTVEREAIVHCNYVTGGDCQLKKLTISCIVFHPKSPVYSTAQK